MTRWTLALALVVSMLTLHTGDALARAGSGGSRGSRSFSRPAAPPTSPMTPSSPSPQSISRAPQPMQPSSPSRGFFGPIMGGLAGFALGGLLGGLLFGHGVGGGFGLLDLLLIAGALYLLHRVVLARRTPQPAYATAGGYGSPQASHVQHEDGGIAAPPVMTPEPPSELDRGIAHIRQMDPTFDPRAVSDTARGLFADVQRGIAARDMRAMSAHLAPRMYAELTAQSDRLRAAGRTNRVEAIDVRRADPTEAWQETGQDYVTVYLAGSLVDYTVDDASGAVVEGQRAPQPFEEYWTFARPVGPNRWKLSAIQTA